VAWLLYEKCLQKSLSSTVCLRLQKELLSELLAALLASCENLGRDSLTASMKKR
jgi:hypothetical protein